jgi:SynChlorMet cassette radical SAM/SPASM protein ScmF
MIPPLAQIYFVATDRCNLRCRHCWIDAGEDGSADELTTEEIREVIDRALPLGLSGVKFTGGEPFLRDDLVELAGYAAGKGLRLRIETNGSLVDGQMARRLGQLDGLQVSVSLDGSSAESHARIRGSAQSYARAVNAIQQLVANGVGVEVITCLYRSNRGEIEEILALVDGWGIARYKINPIVATGRGQELAEGDELLTIEETLSFHQFLEEDLASRYATPVYMDLPVVFSSLSKIARTGLVQCGIQHILGVLPNGDLSLCGIGKGFRDLVFGNAREVSVKEVWECNDTLLSIRREIAAEREGVCRRCMFKGYCVAGHCRALSYARYGSLRQPYPFCEDSYEAGLCPESRLLPESRS